MASYFMNNNLFMDEPISNKNFLEKNSKDIKVQMELLVLNIQQEFCKALEKFEETERFSVDKWKHSEGKGGGITCVMENGSVFEKASVSISVIHGILTPVAYKMMKKKEVSCSDEMPFFTAGITTFVHPKNPHIPTVHFSYRYFEVNLDDDKKDWWFGGCSHMTPNILCEEDCIHFHEVLKSCCDEHNKSFYNCFKRKCDDYFYIPHRSERLGIGGIFFDDLSAPDKESCFQFVSACANGAIPSYIPIVESNIGKKYSHDDRQWQFLRRGRYVEFDLLCDKGVRLPLIIPGVRYENILMCLPPVAKWQHSHCLTEGSTEWKLLNVLRNPIDWV